jgi:hypothetical protein
VFTAAERTAVPPKTGILTTIGQKFCSAIPDARSDEGKAKVSRNALKTGLTGHTVLLPNEDAELYAKHVEGFRKTHAPVGHEETELVQAIADSAWRLARIPSLEAGIYALGRVKLANLFPELDPSVRAQLIEAEIFLTYQRQLNNLSIQEGRLRRQREKDEAKLKELQSKRKQQMSKAVIAYVDAYRRKNLDNFDASDFGFGFTLEEVKARAIKNYPDLQKLSRVA